MAKEKQPLIIEMSEATRVDEEIINSAKAVDLNASVMEEARLCHQANCLSDPQVS